jgi:hypothetical protein
MELLLTPSNIMFAIGIISLLFTIWQKVQGPQIKSEKEQIRIEEDIKDKASIVSQQEVANKAGVLEKQFQWYMESNIQKFADMGKRLDDAFLLATNHTHTVDVKVDELIKTVNAMGLNIERLSTIIEERIPKR